MPDGQIRFATDILRRLGEELNPNIDQGILELVKNAYDADARRCIVRLIDSTRPGGRIEVRDNGDGMTIEAIRNGWLVLGSSSKTSTSRTRLGRIPAGSKGLGRLAALRLGSQAMMTTRPRGLDKEYGVAIDWAQYDEARLVEQVNLPIGQKDRVTRSSGTDIAILGLRNSLGRMDVKRLARAMILLADPFGDEASGFQPVLEAPEFADLEQLVSSRYFGDADYHLISNLQDGIANARVVDWRGNTLFEDSHGELAIARKGRPYMAPNTDFDLWAFVLTRERFSQRASTLQEVRAWIDAFGGVHLYLNGLRVAPYGNPGNDWLDINLRRVQSPEERPSTNTSIGRVAVDDSQGVLSQKTDRSGFIDSPAFDELRAFAQDSLEWMARVRLQAAEARRRNERRSTSTKTSRSRENLREQIEKSPHNVRADLERALDRYDRERNREADALKREVQLYRTLSTAGITAATFAHESSGSPLKVISQSINAVEFRAKRGAPELYEVELHDPIDSIKRAYESLGVLSSATLRLIEADKRRLGRTNLHSVIRDILKTFEPFLLGRDVNLRTELSAGEPLPLSSWTCVCFRQV